jgi:short-subunit dehydrogenase
VRLEGKTVLLTGATGGLGRAMAVALADRGAALVLSSRKAEELDGLVAALPAAEHRAIVCDLAEDGAALRLLDDAGDVDVLVANAGLPASGRLDGFSQEEIGRALRVNLESPVRMARELLSAWQERGSGHFVFISSISGFISTPRASLYAATKFGLRGFALNLREDLRGSGIGVSVITPGAIREAGMFADSGAKAPPGVGTGTPQQVASAVVHAIERDKSEISVAPMRQRALARFAMFAPELSGRVAGAAAARAAEEIAQGQANKR